jgi:predicted alpha/beta-fold hydrolase
VVITSKDDPFVNYKSYLQSSGSPNVKLHIEESGGHMGYLSNEKTPLGNRRWLDYAINETLKAFGH